MRQGAWITGTGQTPYLRRPDESQTTDALLAQAADEAMDEAGVQARDIDGLAVASFTLTPGMASRVCRRPVVPLFRF